MGQIRDTCEVMNRDMNQEKREQVFNRWVSEHKNVLFKVVHAYAFTAHDRDDLFQEIITQVWNSIPRFRGDAAVTTWLYRVALNCALAWSRKERRHRERSEPLETHISLLHETERVYDPRLTWLYEQIAKLDHVDRSLALLLLDGLSYREMAETLGISETYVGVKLSRLKSYLKNLTKEERRYAPQ